MSAMGMGMGAGIYGGGRGIGHNANTEEISPKVRDWYLLSRLLKLLLPQWLPVSASLVCSLVSTALQIINPLIISSAIDVYFLKRAPKASFLAALLPQNSSKGIAFLAALYFCGLVSILLIDSTQNYLAQWTGQMAMAELRRKLLRHLHRLPISFYDVTPAGRLVTRVTTDVEALSDLFANGVVALLANLATTLFFLGVLFWLNWRMTLVLAAVIPLFIVLTTYFRRIITRSQQKVRVLLARINAFIAEHSNGIYVVHLFNRQKACLGAFDDVNHAYMVAGYEWVMANAWFMPSIGLLGTVSQAGLLVSGASLLHGGGLSVGTLVAFLMWGPRYLRPIQDISERYSILQTSIVSAEKVFALLDTEAPEELEEEALVQSSGVGIAFENVWFAYKPDHWVLKDVSFQIREGEMLAIVGHTGAGKTTLSNLLLRFYRAQRGTIRVGGADIGQMHSSDLRRQFGVVLQDTYVREGTILDNIRFGSDEVSSEDARRAAREIGLESMMAGSPDGLDTWVHERGDNLSTGQKQMIAFARALALDPTYLLLDEATSSIDVETEARIRGAMGRLFQNCTSIVIAHRLSTVLTADRILVMHKGQVAESGNHEELLAKRSLYWRLFQIQFGYQSRSDESAGRGPTQDELTEDEAIQDERTIAAPASGGNGNGLRHAH
jgi:ATP-binding cassette, subfamily B, multidrug efflux pump